MSFYMGIGGYRMEFSPDEMATIYFVGDRYGWSSSLLNWIGETDDGGGEIAPLSNEAIADIKEGIESDMEGGHNAFPMLNTRSDVGSALADKLMYIYQVELNPRRRKNAMKKNPTFKKQVDGSYLASGKLISYYIAKERVTSRGKRKTMFALYEKSPSSQWRLRAHYNTLTEAKKVAGSGGSLRNPSVKSNGRRKAQMRAKYVIKTKNGRNMYFVNGRRVTIANMSKKEKEVFDQMNLKGRKMFHGPYKNPSCMRATRNNPSAAQQRTYDLATEAMNLYHSGKASSLKQAWRMVRNPRRRRN
jgi:hypothetical protein